MSGIFQKATGLLRPHILSTSFSLRSFIPAIPLSATMPSTTPQSMAGQARSFHSTPPAQKRVSGRKNPYTGRGGDPKLYIIRRWTPKRMSAPLRMGRNRYLRHWTIHRAWLLYQRNERGRQQQELMRMQQGMSAALEELRQTSGPGTRDEGYLYRVATMKIGVWHMGAIPIEYARMQTETPARLAWNHDWKVGDQDDD